MIRTIVIVLSMIVISAVYGWTIINDPENFSLSTFHIPMVAFDFAAIFLLTNKLSIEFKYYHRAIFGRELRVMCPLLAVYKSDKIGEITDILVVLLALSIVNNVIGGFAWTYSSHNIKDFSDGSRMIVAVIELFVLFVGGWSHRIFSSGNERDYVDSSSSVAPGLLVINSDKGGD